MIKIDNVSYTYSKGGGVSNINLTIDDGEFVFLIGPTGSGKTLAFVLPIVASLQGRMVPRVRAIAVLPTQDLALQVVVACEIQYLAVDFNIQTFTPGI